MGGGLGATSLGNYQIVKITLNSRIKNMLSSYIVFNLVLLFISIISIWLYLEPDFKNLWKLYGLIFFSIFSFGFILSMVYLYFKNDSIIPLLLKLHPLIIIVLYFFSYNKRAVAHEGEMILWIILSFPILIAILIHSIIFFVIGSKYGWLSKN